ncbi:DinB superfamily protein [Chitinophaga ginsengisegetis]|uniref:DinB superfamily protein n=1 Tax=Chitinophaga ginsengisegetis TaxID=393003 RepID=A0A1T5NCC8_9BACT|nr:DinB family protein [Chitinophaga ginsengisegetis]SKC98121.1 DinB superfamily protein [Chitinophaga ginsengisegetis]
METNQVALRQHFNETIEKWMAHLNDYTLKMLCRKPREDAWSLGQVYLHIIADTSYFVEQMKAALLDNANHDKAMHKHAKVMFANNAFPDMLLGNPSNDPYSRQPQSKDELLQGLLRLKQEVNAIDLSTARGKTEHPGLLFFNSLEWLQFAEMHMRHHLRQKERIDEQLFRS